MRNYYVLLLLCLIFGSSCSKEDLSSKSENPIVFDNLKIGQQNRYVLLKGEDYKNTENHQFQYTADTMIIEIIGEDENGFLVEEYLSEGSVSLNGEYHVAFPESIFSYYFNIENEQLTIVPIKEREESRVFFLKNTVLPLEKNYDIEVTVKGWKTSLPYKEDYLMAHVKNYSLLGEPYDFLNIMIDNEGMKRNLPGYTHIYSSEFGLVRSSQYSSETSQGFGWDLLVD